MALIQARELCERLADAHRFPPDRLEIVTFTTSGDRIQDRPLAEAGGKGLFTKEIETALLREQIDIAVHSMKDVPTVLPEGLMIAAYLPREDVRDAFVSREWATLGDLPRGAVLGTSSLRREAQVRRLRPDLRIIPFRGNVDTRLRKIEQGVVDATLLACAGLRRLKLGDRITSAVPIEVILPAVAQGAIGVETRVGDEDTARLVAALNHEPTALCVTAERAFLAKLDGSCRTPIAGLATLQGATFRFRGQILSPDGAESHETECEGAARQAVCLAEEAAQTLLDRAGPVFLRTHP